MGSSLECRGGLALALALLCLGLAAPAVTAAELPYTINEELSLTGDCSTSEADEVHDPDCAGEPPEYPPPPDRPSGRFSRPSSVAVDEWGNLYVASRSPTGLEGRIDIFDPEGHFISELADPHGPRSIAVDSEGNLYAYEFPEGGERKVVRYPPDVYNPAAGEISYDPADRTVIFAKFALHFGLAIDRSTDRLFVADHQRIWEYGSATEGNTLKATIEPEGLGFSTFVAIDAQRRLLYTQACETPDTSRCVIWALEADAPYNLIKEIKRPTAPPSNFVSAQGWISLAVDETNGHLFVGDLAATDDIYEFDAEDEYELVSEFEIPGGNLSAPVQSAVADNPEDPDPEDLNPADNYRHLFVPLSGSSGSAIAFAPPSIGPPIVSGAAAVGIAEGEAELEAQVNPRQLPTTYRIEYVSEAQFAEDGWESAQLAGSGTLPASNKPQRVSAPALGLSPGTAYRFRVVAENEQGSDEEAADFTTYSDADPHPGPCANDALRGGASAALPDCRAYELVTPADTNGGRPGGAGFEGDRFGMVQARPDGSGVSFELASGALPGTEATGGFHGDPYLATRTAAGWSTELSGPTDAQATKPQPGSISPDQGHVFWIAEGTGSAVVPGVGAHYVRYPDGTSELIGRGSLGTDPQALGRLITENADHMVFETFSTVNGDAQKLEPEAPEEGIGAVYDRTADEVTHVVSLLPGEVTPSQGASYLGASADGEGIAFRVGDTLYLRKENAVTYEIGEGLISAREFFKEGKEGLNFAGVSAGGERVFYVEDGDLEAFDTNSESTITFADTAARVVPVNVAPQGNRAYFVSETAIPGSGPGPSGEEPQAGEPNLYLSEGEGTPAFVATVTERDVEGVLNEGTGVELDGLGLWLVALEKRQTAVDSSRLNDDGSVFVFQSRAELTGYESGEFAQVYRYDLEADRLHCLSCPPTATAAGAGAALQSIASLDIAAPFSPYGFVPALALEGERVFFESGEALRSGDTNGVRDVYEWEEEGVGSCTREGGCVYLISSGRGAKANYLFGHGQSGDDVFFTTNDVLVAGDEETLSIYDAKVLGGFADEGPPPCQGEECRPLIAPPPPRPTPESSAGSRSGNVTPGRRCPRGKRKAVRKGRTVCVKKHKKKRRAASRRASR